MSSEVKNMELVRLAVANPYTTVVGAFTAAREAGYMEVLGGEPTRTKKGRALLMSMMKKSR